MKYTSGLLLASQKLDKSLEWGESPFYPCFLLSFSFRMSPEYSKG